VDLRLPFRPPLQAQALLDWLAARAVPGVEEVDGAGYRRSLRLTRGAGVVEVDLDGGADRPRLRGAPDDHGTEEDALRCRLWLDDDRDADEAVGRCRHLLDLDADPGAVGAVLRGDPLLGPLAATAPGLRVPGTVDGAELAVRAVLGQQVSVAAARTAAGRLVASYGERVKLARGGVVALFPSAATLAVLNPASLPMPRARADALVGLCRALAEGGLRLDPGADRDEAHRALLALPGVGPWTAGYVAMRALGDPDVFLVEDLGVRHALARLGGPSDQREARALAQAWAPWRSYASQYLWQAPAYSASRNAKSST
jgi:AraC family transcriptional regulator, regulatory protein of adaptative response / DNA-3-methyladenine glycosylase II